MMKQGVMRLLVRKSITWKGVSKRFSILYHGKWLKNVGASTSSSSTSPSDSGKYCVLSREDVVRFLIGCLGALAPIPLTSISALGAVTPHYSSISASAAAIEAARELHLDPCAVAVVETNPDGTHKIIGEVSAYKLWKCDYLAAAWAMSNLTAGQFVIGGDDDDDDDNDDSAGSLPELSAGDSLRPRKFSSRSIGFQARGMGWLWPTRRNMYRGRSTPLMCKHTSSLAAVMAQMLSHRATHVWVTEAEADDVLVGVVGYSNILSAVTKHQGPN